jgi:sugar phosphate isomerase/epimerase
MSEISPLTIKAYLETDYCVFGEFPFVLRAGIANESLAKLYKRFKTNCGVFVTAFNPFSNDVGEAANTVRQIELAKELNRRNLTYFEGVGKHPSDEWTAEPSYFVLGLSLEAAKALGNKYDQNAVVWCGSDAIPELVLLR